MQITHDVSERPGSQHAGSRGGAIGVLLRALPTLRSRFIVLLVALGGAGLLPLFVAHEAHTQAHGFAHRLERAGSLRHRLSELARHASDKPRLARLSDEQTRLLSALIDGDEATGLTACGSAEVCERLRAHLQRHTRELSPALAGSTRTPLAPELATRVSQELEALDATVRLDATLSEVRIDRIRRIGRWGTLGSLLLVGLVGFGVGEVFVRIRRLQSAVREGDEERIEKQAFSADEIATLARSLADGLRTERAHRQAEHRRLKELVAQQAATRRCTEALNEWLAEVSPLEAALDKIAQATGYRSATLMTHGDGNAAEPADERRVALAWRGHEFGALVLAGKLERCESAADDAQIDGFAQLLTIGCLARRLLDQREKRRQLAAALAAAPNLDALSHELAELVGALVPHERAELALFDERGRTTHGLAVGSAAPEQHVLEVALSASATKVGELTLARADAAFSPSDEEALRDVAPLLASAAVRMQLETRLRDAQRWSALGAFGRHLAHELKNPINTLLLQLTLLERRCQRQGDGEALLGYTRAIRDEAKRLIELVDDSLAVLPAHEGERSERTDLGAVTLAAIGDLEGAFSASHTEIVSEIGSEPAIVRGDETKLRRVVRQLLDDSLARINGSDARRVRIELDRRGHDWCLSIERSGPEYSDPEQLFTPGAERRAAGTGMELALCQWIARAFGGDVSAENAAQDGPRLTLTLPEAS